MLVKYIILKVIKVVRVLDIAKPACPADAMDNFSKIRFRKMTCRSHVYSLLGRTRYEIGYGM